MIGLFFRAIFSSVFGFVAPILKAIPARAWLVIAGVVVLFVAILFWNHHERAIGCAQDAKQIAVLAQRVAELTPQLAECQAANESTAGAIARLELDKQACETGRLADHNAAALAISAHQANEAKYSRDAEAQRAKLRDLNANRCKAWAEQPACGGEP